jgi:type II secretory pathway component PulF
MPTNTNQLQLKWKRFSTNHPLGTFIIVRLGEGLFSGLGSIVIYIIVFLIIYKWFKKNNEQNAVVNALGYRMPGLHENTNIR